MHETSLFSNVEAFQHFVEVTLFDRHLIERTCKVKEKVINEMALQPNQKRPFFPAARPASPEKSGEIT